jgi:tetratricopeptide (TPR) repeat protein
VAGVLRLEVREFRDLTRWRWVLTDSSGAFLADHEVRLDAASWQYEAFGDLRWYLRWHCAPDRRAEDEARIVGEVGAWTGTEVLGPAVAAALVRGRPVTVRVVVPPEAAELVYRPLELAHANGKPLAVQDVTLVMESGTGTVPIEPVGERLRVLGLFSLPEGGRALNLRRERAELVRLVRGIAATGKAADVRVLQYGVTRERLRDVLEEAEGWDIIHVSGHGRPGSLTLETASAQPDRVTAAELADLLDQARTRLKLVTVSACWSAAVLADEQRRLLGLPARDQDQDDPAERDRGDGSASPSSGALASELAAQLGCAVLAMRYPVGDDFAIALSGKLYGLLAEKGQPLARAVGMALRELSTATGGTGSAGNGAGSGAFSALSMGTPALFGGMAVDLRLAAPSGSGSASYDTARSKMAGFPPEPSRFVGRTGVLARSSAALAALSGVPGVLLHGMPGGGKTACALELAYGHEEAFDRLVWYKAPDEGMGIDGALTDFALTLERFLPGFQMADALVSADALTSSLPRLTELMERRRLLIVIDNVESLVSDGGKWRDGRWGLVVGALTRHSGFGRVILTCRRVPADGLADVRAEAVGALSADEALLLARELPNLSALKLGAIPGIGPKVSQQLARNAIALAQGHPKLLELAEGQAANSDHLLKLVKTGDQEWRRLGGVPDGFFTSGESSASGEDYLRVLAVWTKAVTDTLAPGERDLFWFLCCLEETDREWTVVDAVWPGLWKRLCRDDQPPRTARALAAIAVDALVAQRGEGVSYRVHPGVAAAGRDDAGQPFRDSVDAEVAAYWEAVHWHASGQGGDGTVDTALLVRAGLAAAPYYLRQRDWERTAFMLESAFLRDPSRANAAAVLPALQQVTEHEPRHAGALARVLQVISPAAAEAATRGYLDAAVARGDFGAASVAAERLSDLGRVGGRLAEALHFAGQQAEYARRAGLGPWTQLSSEVQRLHVLNEMGQASQVLEQARLFRDRMGALSAIPGPDDTAPVSNVRERLLDAGRDAARQLGQWEEALDMNAAIVASMRGRRAPATNIAWARFSDYGPLLNLGRTDEALALLLDCRQVFQDSGDIAFLGKTISALADTEYRRGHGDAAIRLEGDALRYKYLAGDVHGIAVGYHNLGNYLHLHARSAGAALASHLAAALIHALAGTGLADDSAGAAAEDLREFGSHAVPPRDVADLCSDPGRIPGTDLPGLIARLSHSPETAEQALRDLIAQAQALSAQD